MKKISIMALLLTVLLLLSVAGCAATPIEPDSKLPEPFSAVLCNQQTFYANDDKKDVLLSDYLAHYDDSILKYALVDMDSDDQPELVMQLKSLNFVLMIKKDGDIFRGFLFNLRGMYQIHRDGTHYWNDSASASGCSRLQFKDGQYERVNLWNVENYGSDTAVYYVDYQVVSKEYYDTVASQEREEVEWILWQD